MNREIRIDLGRIIQSLMNKWWIIIISAACCLAVSSILTMSTGDNTYRATTTVYSVINSGSAAESLTGGSLMSAYANVISSRKVAENALALLPSGDLTAEKIMNMISVSGATSNQKANTIISISADATDADQAVIVANAVANAFVNEIQNMTDLSTVQILDSAQKAVILNNARVDQLKFRLLGTLIGLLFPIIIIILVEIFSLKMYRVSDATLNGQLEILAVIPDYDN